MAYQFSKVLKSFEQSIFDPSIKCLICSNVCVHEFGSEVQCVQGHHLWRDSSSIITTELFTGYHEGNSKKKINEILAGWRQINKVLAPLNQLMRLSYAPIHSLMQLMIS